MLFRSEDGNPKNGHSRIGELRARAKPYGEVPTGEHRSAADELAAEIVTGLKSIACYEFDAVVGTPPSDPDSELQIPALIAQQVAAEFGAEDMTKWVSTSKKRVSVKDVCLSKKLDAIKDTVSVDQSVFVDRSVLLIDDLYQSGITMNYVGSLISSHGASEVSGIACVKTCSNDDNTSRR